jgi:5-methyltetrahydrofolate--homocysteine methyltransferase
MVVIVGERINSTRKDVLMAIKERDGSFIMDEARRQREAGADYIDCNAAAVGMSEEPEALAWVVELVQEATGAPCAIDSPNPEAIRRALEVHSGQAMVNSITAERSRFELLIPLILEHKAKVIALCIDESGMPSGLEDRLEKGRRITDMLLDAGIPPSDIYIDPLVFPISINQENGISFLKALAKLKELYPDANTIGGISNVSFGLPARRVLNRAFVVLAIGMGIDALILDPTDGELMSLIFATEALLGRDEFCMGYISAAREGRIRI